MKSSVFLIAFLVTLVALSGCIGQGESGDRIVMTNYRGGEVTVYVELAETPDEVTIGLMHRESLDEDAGMLFIFEDEDFRYFWMKNTLIPLDMIFIDSTLTIVDIKKDVQPCEADPCPLYPSADIAMYVLEVNAGFSEKNGIGIGDKVEILS